MLIVDDLLIKPFFSMLDILHKMALDEMYDIEVLRDELKENQLLYEIGERSETEYQQRKNRLQTQVEIAEQIRARMQGRFEVKG
ncbi:MAG: gas vesicle protein G [halophilic archaeon J07HX5]|nr:MAG: gas vesicle protein G [halophilic archaeon J07HX5]